MAFSGIDQYLRGLDPSVKRALLATGLGMAGGQSFGQAGLGGLAVYDRMTERAAEARLRNKQLDLMKEANDQRLEIAKLQDQAAERRHAERQKVLEATAGLQEKTGSYRPLTPEEIKEQGIPAEQAWRYRINQLGEVDSFVPGLTTTDLLSMMMPPAPGAPSTPGAPSGPGEDPVDAAAEVLKNQGLDGPDGQGGPVGGFQPLRAIRDWANEWSVDDVLKSIVPGGALGLGKGVWDYYNDRFNTPLKRLRPPPWHPPMGLGGGALPPPQGPPLPGSSAQWPDWAMEPILPTFTQEELRRRAESGARDFP